MSMYDEMAKIPKLARGLVWCTVCGAQRNVDSKFSLQYGWPKCCGYTMTLDSPQERKPRESQS